MGQITIRELHLKTGHWVRTAARGRQGILVLDRGRPAARLLPAASETTLHFSQRKHVPGFARLPAIRADSARGLEQDRR
jgi:antitoxin (DNA-binding transcriptional repressor) of toxin-antitoxin stability system